MKAYEIITLSAILIGPILAVVVQIIAENRKQVRDQQAATFRMLASTRHLPSDPAYSTAINMIPIDFNRVKPVMSAHESYIETILYHPTAENSDAHNQQIVMKQTKLIFEMARHLGHDLPETKIQSTAYAAGGFVERDNLMTDSWRAWSRIADALEAQNRAYFSASPNTDGESK